MSLIKKYLSDEKDIEVVKNILASFLIKGGALFISLFSLPAYIRYFDNQAALGLWFTVLSVMIWILSFDLGIGNGLRNKLVDAIVRENQREVKEYVSSAYIIIGTLVVIVLVIGYTVFPIINWNGFFNIEESIISKNTMLFMVKCVFTGVLIQFLLKLISSILYALQKSAVTNLLSLITSGTQLIFVLLSPSFDLETNLKMLSIVYILCVNIPLLVVSVVIFTNQLKGCAPNIKYFTQDKARNVLKLGGIFFWVQIMYMIIAVTNEFFVSQFTKPEYVVDYQIYNRLFTIVGMLFSLALTPMWSAITKAISENDSKWLNKTYKIMNKLVLFAVVCEFMILPFLQFIVDIWLGKNAITIDYRYASIFAIYGSIFIYLSVLSTVVSGMGKLRLQAICYSIGVILKVVIIYFGVMLFDSWIVVIASNAIILLPYCILQAIFIKRDFILLDKGEYKHV